MTINLRTVEQLTRPSVSRVHAPATHSLHPAPAGHANALRPEQPPNVDHISMLAVLPEHVLITEIVAKLDSSGLAKFRSLNKATQVLANAEQRHAKIIDAADIPAVLKRFPNISSLDLSACENLTNADLEQLPLATGLRALNLRSRRSISDMGLTRLTRCRSLERLNLSGGAGLTNFGLARIAQLTNLRRLDLTDCENISDLGLLHLAGCNRLEHLTLAVNENITDAGLSNLASLRTLEHLDLTMCPEITEAGLAMLAPCTRLRDLILTNNAWVHDGGLAALTTLKRLRRLDLSMCLDISDAGLGVLGNATQLHSLALLGNSHITDAGLANLRPLVTLRNLELTCGADMTPQGIIENLAPHTRLQKLRINTVDPARFNATTLRRLLETHPQLTLQ